MKLSIIIPCFNEEKVLGLLFKRLTGIIKNLKLRDWEVILVNDGSLDNTAEIVKKISQKNHHFKALHFSRNFGHQAALLAGLIYCSGEAAFLLDADLQDPPELLAKFIEKYHQGYEVVYGVRISRQENFFKKSLYHLYYRLFKYLSEIDIPIESGDFCLLSRRVIDLIISMPEKNKYLRGLRYWTGFKQIGIKYHRSARQAGKSKYSFKKLFKLSYDGIFGFSKMPLKISFWLGIFLWAGCLLTGIVLLILFFVFNLHNLLPGYTSIVLLILFLGGVQLFFIGLIGEYISRILEGVNDRPDYIIESMNNLKKKTR